MDIDKLKSVGSDIQGLRTDKNAKEEGKKLFGDFARAEQKKQAIHWAAIIFIVIGTISLVAVLVVRLLQLVLPQESCWLSTEQIQTIDHFLFSGTAGAILVSFFKKHFLEPNSQA